MIAARYENSHESESESDSDSEQSESNENGMECQIEPSCQDFDNNSIVNIGSVVLQKEK